MVRQLIDDLVAPVLDHLDLADPGEVIGVYLYGSGATTGLRPDSDVDLLILTRSPLTSSERDELVSMLLNISGWRGHETEFPDAVDRRPFEVTSLVLSDLRPLTNRPRRDFQFGEWMRSTLLDGEGPPPAADPDVVIILATALSAHRVLRGPDLTGLVAPVSAALLQQAQREVIPGLVHHLAGDERNALLTLARIIVTTKTGRIVPKEQAAEYVLPQLDGDVFVVLDLARKDYLGQTRVDWDSQTERVAAAAKSLIELIDDAA